MGVDEHTEQKLFFQWCLRHADEYEGLHRIFAIPNGGNIDAVRGRRLKEEGLRAGVPDMFLPHPIAPFGGLFIELKVRGGGIVSDAQKAWISELTCAGYQCVVAKGFPEAKQAVENYYARA